MIDLQKFCAYDGAIFNTVLTVPVYDNGFTYATNGHLCVRIPGEHAEPRTVAYPNVEKLFTENPPSGKWQEPPQCEVQYNRCSRCGGVGKATICPDCDGDGVLYFYAEHSKREYEFNCKECEEEGYLPDEDGNKCGLCGGSGKHVKDLWIPYPGLIAPSGVNVRLISLIKDLPGILMDAEPKQGERFKNKDFPIPFKFDGGEGLIMPMVDPKGRWH